MMVSSIAEIIRDLLIFVVVMAALLITLVVVISKMPDSSPLKRLLTALSYRLGATLAAGAVAVPLEPIPGIDALYDIGVPIALIWYWFTFFRDVRHMKSDPRSQPDQRQITRHDR
jgi:hypothetical protein